MPHPSLDRRLRAILVGALALLLLVGVTPTADASDHPDSPTITEAEVDGAKLDMAFSTKLDTAFVPAAGDFTVTVDGDPRMVASVRLPNRHFARLTLAERVVEGETVTVSYANGDRPLRDRGGAEVESFDAQPVTNHTPPAPWWRWAQAQRSSETWVVVATFEGALDSESVPSPHDFTITVNGSPRQPVAVNVWFSGRPTKRRFHTDAFGRTIAIVEKGLRSDVGIRMEGPSIGPGAVVTIAYARGETPLRDLDGNEVADFGPVPVVNAFDPARFFEGDVDGTILLMLFDQFITHAILPDPGDFTVTVDGSRRSVAQVQPASGGRATFLVLVLSSPVAAGEEVTFTYTRGETPLQEYYGDQVASFGPVPVANVGGPPEFNWAEVDGERMRVIFQPRPDTEFVPQPGDFTVTVDGSNRAVRRVNVGVDSIYTLTRVVRLTLAEPVNAGEYVTVAYAPGSTALRHEGGDVAPRFEAMPAANVTAPSVPVELPEFGTFFTIIGVSGSVSELRAAATEACPLGVDFYATVDGDFIPFIPRWYGRIVNRAFEEAFADGLDDELLIVENCRAL